MKIIDLSAKEIEARAISTGQLAVTLTNVDADDLLACMEPKLLDALLDAIGAEKCIDHFELAIHE